MDVILSAEHITDKKWIEINLHCRAQNKKLLDWFDEQYEAEPIPVNEGEYLRWRFKKEKYVEFCLQWL